MARYQSDPDRAGDEDYEQGGLAHLVVGNQARLLDPRRTPLTVVGVTVDTGLMRVRVAAFEDTGAVWALPVERVDGLQFPRGVPLLSDAAVEDLRAASARLDHCEHRPRDQRRLVSTTTRLAHLTASARELLTGVAPVLPLTDESTHPGLAAVALDWWRSEQVTDLEADVAGAWASSPGGNETVKAHLMVLAGLGLADYRGPVLRDPTRLLGRESAQRRERHILARLGFVRAMFAHAGLSSLTLYRGYALTGAWNLDRPAYLISATADRDVAEAHFAADTPSGLLQRSTVAVQRVFMTWLETPQLSHPYRESEVTLLPPDAADTLF